MSCRLAPGSLICKIYTHPQLSRAMLEAWLLVLLTLHMTVASWWMGTGRCSTYSSFSTTLWPAAVRTDYQYLEVRQTRPCTTGFYLVRVFIQRRLRTSCPTLWVAATPSQVHCSCSTRVSGP